MWRSNNSGIRFLATEMQLFVKVVATPVVEVIASAVIGPSFGLPAGLGDPRHRLRLTVRNALFLSHNSAETEVIKNGRPAMPSSHPTTGN